MCFSLGLGRQDLLQESVDQLGHLFGGFPMRHASGIFDHLQPGAGDGLYQPVAVFQGIPLVVVAPDDQSGGPDLSDIVPGHRIVPDLAKLVERGHETKEESRKGWLYRVAYHEAMSVRRRQVVDDVARRRVAWSGEAAGEPAESPLLRAETVHQVRQAIEGLPAEQRQVVRMRIYEDKTFAAIAEELRIPLGTALGRMRAAMKKLRTRLERER